ncbi:hypothetical protein [Mucilaginibacter panaciglaebae]|uniref:MORN repeat protein n=1 Tax=Mucilaginibacter panaciglaebae TaxID=502331 RepID=A0ABP7WFL1_9SPHI
MKNLLTLILCFFCLHTCLAQTVQKKNYIIDDVYERYKAGIDSNDVEIRNGSYTAYNGKKTIANGQYKNGKRVGIWYFYNREGKEMQQYDYDNSKLLFEAPETDHVNFRYRVDYVITGKDKVTPPIKLGGRFFGYLAYLKLMRKIHDLRGLNPNDYVVILKILVSPMGRMADCTVELLSRSTGQSATYMVNTDELPESDKIFIPASFNGEPVSSRVEVLCQPDDDGEINIAGIK